MNIFWTHSWNPNLVVRANVKKTQKWETSETQTAERSLIRIFIINVVRFVRLIVDDATSARMRQLHLIPGGAFFRREPQIERQVGRGVIGLRGKRVTVLLHPMTSPGMTSPTSQTDLVFDHNSLRVPGWIRGTVGGSPVLTYCYFFQLKVFFWREKKIFFEKNSFF
jgi:hypothetical protein